MRMFDEKSRSGWAEGGFRPPRQPFPLYLKYCGIAAAGRSGPVAVIGKVSSSACTSTAYYLGTP